MIYDFYIDYPLAVTFGLGVPFWLFCGWLGYRVQKRWWRTHKQSGW